MWLKKEMPIIPGYESLGDSVAAKRWLDFKLDKLLEGDSELKDYINKNVDIKTRKDACNFVISSFDYPLVRGQPTDIHKNNWFSGLCCHQVTLDYFQTAAETLRTLRLNQRQGKNGYGDCLPLDIKIIALADGKYKVRYFGDLKIGDEVLSYNWKEGKFEPRKITAIMEKGALPVLEVKLRNGSSFQSTLDHHFFKWNHSFYRHATHNRNGHPFFRQRLSEIDYKHSYENSILLAREIPSLNLQQAKDAQLWLEGAYAAEGWSEGGHTCISGDDPSYKFQTAACLIQTDTCFAMSKRSKSSYFRIHASPLRGTLEQMGHNAFDKQFIESRLSASRKQLELLLDGYAKGDCYLNPRNSDIRYNNEEGINPNSHRVRVYATSSDELASQLRLLHLILGRPLHSWYQTNHQGAGKSPIWRLTENTNSAFNKEILPGISKVSIKEIKELGKTEVRDITVEGNHNFVLADSFIIASNCEDVAALLATVFLIKKWPVWDCLGAVYQDNQLLGGHSFDLFQDEDGKWRLYEATLSSTPEYPGEYPEVDPNGNYWYIKGLTYYAFAKFIKGEYYEWEEKELLESIGRYLSLSLRRKETRAKHEAISLAWGIKTKPLVKMGLMSKLRWRK